jgi:ubiquinone/menaquinone biosynthesis C-methylase UbiE
MGNQWHFEPDTYLAMVRSEIPDYDELQSMLADATTAVEASRILDLGSGTGVTARSVLDRHADAELIGIDGSDGMLVHARELVPEGTFRVQQLEEPLPDGSFDLVTSAFAVHHLDAGAKAELFGRIARALAPGGRFVLCDVVVPTAPVARPVPLDEGIDQPSPLADQVAWLRAAGLAPTVLLERADLAIVAADRGGA